MSRTSNPRTSLIRHLFSGWCVLLTTVLLVFCWLASLEMARLSEESQYRRLLEAAMAVSGTPISSDRPVDLQLFQDAAQDIKRAVAADIDLIDSDGFVVSESTPHQAAARNDAVPRSSASRSEMTSRYDAATGRRTMVVSVPLERMGIPTTVIRVSADTSLADAKLAGGQRRLLLGTLAGAVAAAVAAWVFAYRTGTPVRELSIAAAQLADGTGDGLLPVSGIAEVSTLAGAIDSLRRQLVERGLTIGRQGTQQDAVLGSMIEGVLAIDGRQRIVSANRAAADLLGIDPDTVAGRSLQEVIRNPDLRRFALLALDCRETVEDDLVLRGLRDRTIRVRGTPLRDASGAGGAVIVLNDVTDIQHLENVRRDFVANVSHELRTPVASIKGFVETLLDDGVDDPADRRRFLEIVARQSDRLGSIIEDLLALSRIEQTEGTGDLPLERVEIADLLAAVIADCRPRADERSIAIEATSPPGLTADVNAPLLEQAIMNLVENAIKYSEPGRTVWVSAAARPGPERGLLIEVRDEGTGIAAEHLPRLFERFYRVDKGRSRTLGGTGLGLSIVKHIVQAHGGSVAVESEPGVGSTFRVLLPAALC